MLRILLALGAFFVAGVAFAACGGVPGNSVAKVDDAAIKKSTFNHWLVVAAKSSQPPGAGGAVAVPDPPDFTKCVAAAKKQLPNPTRGQPRPTDKQLKAQCKQQYDGLRDQVMQFLINAEWLQGEAADQDIKVSEAEITRSFNQQKQQQFPKQKDFDNFLRQSGMTIDDLRFNVELTLLSNKLREKVTKGKGTVTQAQIRDYYNRNRQRFAQPETRDINLVLTKNKANAQKALDALEDGDSFKQVAKKFSIDPATKEQGGKLTGVTKGQQDPAFDKAVFAAKKGELEGPVESQFGWFVFEVVKVTPAKQQTLQEAAPQIRQILTSERQQKALQSFVKDFEKKWKSRTECRKGYIVQVCDNSEKPKQQKRPPGAVPTQQPAQQPTQDGAPPGGGAPPPDGGGQGAPPPAGTP